VDARAPADLDLPLDIEVDAATIVAAVELHPGPVAPPHPRTAPGPPPIGVDPPRPRTAPEPRDADDLTEHQRSILDFERLWWRRPGAKEQAIRDNFEMSPTRYYQALNGLIDLPQALLYDPALVNRLLRLRAGAERGRRLR
jgi:hypothetical protein